MANDFLPWANSSSANVLSQAAYAALGNLQSGVVAGVASSQQANKTWRQSSIIASMVAQAIADATGQPSVDDGTIATLEANFFNMLRTIGYAADTGLVNTLTINLSPAPPGLTNLIGVLVRVLVKNTNTGASTLNVNGLGAIPIVNPDGSVLLPGQLLANDVVILIYNGGSFILVAGSPTALRIRLTAPMNLYVATNGSDSNPGTSAAPFLTIQKAINTIWTDYDLNGFNVTINVANGTYTTPTFISGQQVGLIAGSTQGAVGGLVSIVGNTASPDNVLIAVSNNSCFFVANGAKVTVSGLKVQTSGGSNAPGFFPGWGFIIVQGASVNIANCSFGSCSPGGHIWCSTAGILGLSGAINVEANGAIAHIQCDTQALIDIQYATWNVSPSVGFGTAFAVAQNCATIAAVGSSSTGSNFSGQRWQAITNSVISGIAQFPNGTVAGAAATGGQGIA